MSEKEILLKLLELLQEHYPYVREFLFAKLPEAKVILADESEAERKLRELQRLESTED